MGLGCFTAHNVSQRVWGTLHTCDWCWCSCCRGSCVLGAAEAINAGAGWLPAKADPWLCSMLLAVLDTVHTSPGSKCSLARQTCQHGPRGGAWFQFFFSLLVIFMKPLGFASLKFQNYSNIPGLNWLSKITWILRMMKWSPGHTEIVKTFWHWLTVEQGFCWQLL